MFDAVQRAWVKENIGVARLDVVDGGLVVEVIDSRTGIVALDPVWLTAHGFGHHVEDEGATVRLGEHVFTRVRMLGDSVAAYEVSGPPRPTGDAGLPVERTSTVDRTPGVVVSRAADVGRGQ